MAVRVWNVSVPSSEPATLIVDANPGRTELYIENNDPSNTVYIGPINQTTSSIGFPIYGHNSSSRNRGFQIWLGPVYAIASSGTIDVRIWETYDIRQDFVNRIGDGVDSNSYSLDNNSIIMNDGIGFILQEDGISTIQSE